MHSVPSPSPHDHEDPLREMRTSFQIHKYPADPSGIPLSAHHRGIGFQSLSVSRPAPQWLDNSVETIYRGQRFVCPRNVCDPFCTQSLASSSPLVLIFLHFGALTRPRRCRRRSRWKFDALFHFYSLSSYAHARTSALVRQRRARWNVRTI